MPIRAIANTTLVRPSVTTLTHVGRIDPEPGPVRSTRQVDDGAAALAESSAEPSHHERTHLGDAREVAIDVHHAELVESAVSAMRRSGIGMRCHIPW